MKSFITIAPPELSMKIVFKEDRVLLSGEHVKAGESKEFTKKEAEAFIRNGVAKKAKKEN